MQKKILDTLLDKYEKSKSFNNRNVNHQSFSVEPVKLFRQYSDDSQVDFCMGLNLALQELEKKDFVTVAWDSPSKAKKITLNVNSMEDVYAFLGRKKRDEEQHQILDILKEFENSNPILQNYIDTQRQRIADNKNVEYYDAKCGLNDFKDILKAVDFLVKNDEEILVRNASLTLYRDSKRLEVVISSVESLMRKYGDYEGCEDVLAECNVVKTPTQVLVKGNAVLNLMGQVLDLSKMDGDIGLSTKSLKDVRSVNVLGNRVVTVENLTSFYTYGNRDDFVIYLGGFHNSVKRDFIRKVFTENASKLYMHFGDIDAGGLYILKHLRNRTGIEFVPMYMDVETLKKYDSCVKPLTKEDLARLKRLKEDTEFDNLISYMLEHNCKLEQENVVVS